MLIDDRKEYLFSMSAEDFLDNILLNDKMWYFEEYLGFDENICEIAVKNFKNIIGDGFHTSAENVYFVGSAKLGFSLKKGQCLREFICEGDTLSDIDIAVVSEEMFNQLWDLLRAEKRVYYNAWYYSVLAKEIYHGYVNDFILKNIQNTRSYFKGVIRSVNESIFIDDLLSQMVHERTYRVYRRKSDLVDYQLHSISVAKSWELNLEGRDL